MRNRGKWLAMITLDIRNAFYTVSWDLITKDLRKRVPAYLQNVVENYLAKY